MFSRAVVLKSTVLACTQRLLIKAWKNQSSIQVNKYLLNTYNAQTLLNYIHVELLKPAD
jgi:hypothetical protein